MFVREHFSSEYPLKKNKNIEVRAHFTCLLSQPGGGQRGGAQAEV